MNISDYNKMSNKDKQDYESSLKRLYVILGIGTILFYLIPFATMFAGELTKIIIPILLINVNTVYVFISCFLHSVKYNFKIIVPAAIAIFFVPTIIIFYGGDYKMIFMALIYFVLGIFGEFTGYIFRKRKESKRQPIGLNKLVNGRENKKENKKYNKKSGSTKRRK